MEKAAGKKVASAGGLFTFEAYTGCTNGAAMLPRTH